LFQAHISLFCFPYPAPENRRRTMRFQKTSETALPVQLLEKIRHLDPPPRPVVINIVSPVIHPGGNPFLTQHLLKHPCVPD